MSRAARRPWPPARSPQASREGQPRGWPERRYGWVAHFADGSRLHEVYDAPPLTPFEAVEKARTARFSLVDLRPGGEGEIVAIDCESGIVHARGRRLEFALGDEHLTGRPGGYRDVIQYKSAHVDHRPGVGSTGTIVDGHHVGYRRRLAEGLLEAVLRLDVTTRRIGLTARLTPPGAVRGVPGPLLVLLDGQPVPAEAAFVEALRPPSHPRCVSEEPPASQPRLTPEAPPSPRGPPARTPEAGGV